MQNNPKDILSRIDDRLGYPAGSVPDGYFEAFAERMQAALPEQPWESTAATPAEPQRRSVWHIIRPYVYMAAAFMGIWCMMSVFDHVKPASMSPLDSPELTAALADDSFVYDYFMDPYYDDGIGAITEADGGSDAIPAAEFSE